MVILLLTSTVSYVFGNAGPPMMGPSGEKLIFDEDSGVALKEEWVTIDLTSEEEGTVEVRYHLENLHRETEDLEMLFILPRDSDFTELFWNGEAVEEISERPYDQLPTNWSTAGDLTVREPLSGDAFDGDQYDYGRFSTMDGYKGLAFTVTLPEGETGELRLRYPSYSGYFRSSEIMSTAVQLVNPVHYKIYYLTPGRFWEGDAKAHLEFRLPEGSYAVHSNIALEDEGSGIHRTTLESLPEEEWVVSYASTTWLLFGTNYQRIHNTFVIGVILLIFVTSLILTKKKDARFIWLMLLIIPAFFLFRMGYGGAILFLMMAPIVAVLILWGLMHLYLKMKDRLGASGH